MADCVSTLRPAQLDRVQRPLPFVPWEPDYREATLADAAPRVTSAVLPA